MAKNLLSYLALEEKRIHEAFIQKGKFLLFPAVIFSLSFFALLPFGIYRQVAGFLDLNVISNLIFFLFGATIGSFGLSGKSVLSLRFGELRFLPYSYQILPITQRRMFRYYVLKEIIFYLLFFILPVSLSALLAFPLNDIPLSDSFFFSLSICFSFLFGMGLSFIFSSIYQRKRGIGKAILLLFTVFFAYDRGSAISGLFLPNFVTYTKSPDSVFLNIIACTLLPILSIAIFRPTYPVFEIKHFKDQFKRLKRRISILGKEAPFVSKDLVEMKRSVGASTKLIFLFFIPLFFSSLILFYVKKLIYLTPRSFYLFYSLISGIIALTVYHFITEFDFPKMYAHLPVDGRKILRSKFKGFSLIALISLLLAHIFSIYFFEIGVQNIVSGLLLSFTSSLYFASLMLKETGVFPNMYFFDPKVILRFLLFSVPVITFQMFGILSGLGDSFFVPSSLFILALSYLIYRSSEIKWKDLVRMD
jgi:hypothetical protein